MDIGNVDKDAAIRQAGSDPRSSEFDQMIEAVIFDVDGTLVDSVDLHASAWQDAFKDFGHEIAFADIRTQIGKGGDELMPVFLSADDLREIGDKLEAHRSKILKNIYLAEIRPFPKVRELMKGLLARDVRFALASSAKSDELDFYKKTAGIDDLIEIETSADDASRSKPNPDIFQAAIKRLGGIAPANVIVVGDTPYDAEAAAKAGLRTVGVLCGGFPEQDLRRAGCVAIYRDPADLYDNIEEVLAS